ncbi:MAG: hypothetical protein HY749_25170 [Gammaproteobacteria bacterium]|nr:hypothetical protein [Gammaproteobacteria bacterium]
MTNERGPQVSSFGAAGSAGREAVDVKDNAMRSVSMRINTSDFGRIKVMAKRLRARESDVFRLLIKIGLADLAPLCDGAARGRDLIETWCAFGAAVTSYLALDVHAVDRVLNGDAENGAEVIDRDDVALLAMLNAPPRYLALRLKDLTGEEHAPERIREELAAYLRSKYSGLVNRT